MLLEYIFIMNVLLEYLNVDIRKLSVCGVKFYINIVDKSKYHGSTMVSIGKTSNIMLLLLS